MGNKHYCKECEYWHGLLWDNGKCTPGEIICVVTRYNKKRAKIETVERKYITGNSPACERFNYKPNRPPENEPYRASYHSKYYCLACGFGDCMCSDGGPFKFRPKNKIQVDEDET